MKNISKWKSFLAAAFGAVFVFTSVVGTTSTVNATEPTPEANVSAEDFITRIDCDWTGTASELSLTPSDEKAISDFAGDSKFCGAFIVNSDTGFKINFDKTGVYYTKNTLLAGSNICLAWTDEISATRDADSNLVLKNIQYNDPGVKPDENVRSDAFIAWQLNETADDLKEDKNTYKLPGNNNPYMLTVRVFWPGSDEIPEENKELFFSNPAISTDNKYYLDDSKAWLAPDSWNGTDPNESGNIFGDFSFLCIPESAASVFRTSTADTSDTKVIDFTDKTQTIITYEDMQALVKENATKTVEIKSNSGISFIFEPGELKNLDANQKYDFGTSIDSAFENARNLPKDVTKDKFIKKINFNYSGNLPGTAKIKIPVGKEYANTLVNYSLVSSTGLTETKSYTVDADGYITVLQNHCSDWVVTKAETTTDDTVKSPKTGVDNSLYVISVLLMMGAFAGLLLIKRTK